MTEEKADERLSSQRPEPEQRFLAKYIEVARRAKVIDNAGLFRKYPQQRIFEAYADEPKSRAALLEKNSQMPFAIAEHLDVAGCLQVFNIALEKLGEATPDKVFAVVTPDELVRLFPAGELFAFLEEPEWDARDTPEHRTLVRQLLAEFKVEELGGGPTGTLRAIEEAIGIDQYVEHLPKPALAAIIKAARELADKHKPNGMAFSVDAMAEAAPTDLLAQHLPLPVLMRPIRAFAERVGWVKKPEEQPQSSSARPQPAEEPAPAASGADDEAIKRIVDPRTEPPPPPPKGREGDDPEMEVGEGEAKDLDAELEKELEALERETVGTDGEKAEVVLRLDDDGDDDRTQVRAHPLVPPPGSAPAAKGPPPLRKQKR